jgi:hypothetical protein
MKTNLKKQRLIDSLIALVLLTAIGPPWIYESASGQEGLGSLIRLILILFWIYSLVRYTEAKGRSGILGLFLSFFGPLGLIVAIALSDKSEKRK